MSFSPTPFESQLVFAEAFPFELFDAEKDLLIIDEVVAQKRPQFCEKFRFVYRVQAGESLKNLATFAEHVENVLELWNLPLSRQSRIISCGGGSVGDFSGFLASVLKRGLRLTQCPTTWLASIDSAHGGKTALNVKAVKNQVGTFYPAETVLLVKDLLLMQGEERAQEGLSELIKIALVSRPSFFNELQLRAQETLADVIWQNLEQAIRAKNAIVVQDPYETKGKRKILNFGHTLGHVIESYYQVSHGESVQQGLYFSIEWSSKCGLLPETQREAIFSKWSDWGLTCWLNSSDFRPIPTKDLIFFLKQDKKMNIQEQIDFIFLKNFGDAQVIPVTVRDLVFEAQRQGWVRDV